MRYNYKYRNSDGDTAPYVLELNGKKIINPTAEMYAEAGYYPYEAPAPSEAELAEQARLAEIEQCKEQLAATDYIALKSYEGYDCEVDHPHWREQRAALRARINELEGGAEP